MPKSAGRGTPVMPSSPPVSARSGDEAAKKISSAIASVISEK